MYVQLQCKSYKSREHSPVCIQQVMFIDLTLDAITSVQVTCILRFVRFHCNKPGVFSPKSKDIAA